jgi:hypothetical protein
MIRIIFTDGHYLAPWQYWSQNLDLRKMDGALSGNDALIDRITLEHKEFILVVQDAVERVAP